MNEAKQGLGQEAISKILALKRKGYSNAQIAEEFRTEIWVVDLILQLGS